MNEPARSGDVSQATPLDPAFLRRLERLAVTARRTLRGVGQGERRSKRHGGTVEFADTRPYSAGDDTRAIDWYAYARLEQLLLKLYVEEQDLTVHLLVDHSASMGSGTPPKLPLARQLAVALAFIGLAAGDRVAVRPFRGGEAELGFGPSRGRAALPRLLRFLSRDGGARGASDLRGATRAFLARRPAPGVVVLVSDLLDDARVEPAEVVRALDELRHAGHEVHAIHLVAPDEAEPQVGQDVDLVDVESGEVVAVSLTRAAVRAYRAAFAERCALLRARFGRAGIGYALVRSDQPFEEVVLGTLREGALLR